MSRILVTGGAGFIGGHLLRKLLSLGHQVCNLDSLTYAADRSWQTYAAVNYQFVRGNINDAQVLQSLLMHFRPEVVFHLAAETHVDRSISDANVFVMTNVVGTTVLLDAVLQYWRQLPKVEQQAFRFLHVSTDEVYGDIAGEAATETTGYCPSSPYSASKASADHLVSAYHRTYGLPVIISHCSNNYGSYQYPEKLIPKVINLALQQQPLPIYGDGMQSRDWLHVEDHVDALMTLAAAGAVGQTYNVASGDDVTNIDLVRLVCDMLADCYQDSYGQATSYVELIEFVTDRPGHDRRYALNADKLQQQCAWRPRWKFSDGLRDTVRWYFTNSDWLSRRTSDLGEL